MTKEELDQKKRELTIHFSKLCANLGEKEYAASIYKNDAEKLKAELRNISEKMYNLEKKASKAVGQPTEEKGDINGSDATTNTEPSSDSQNETAISE